MFQPSFIRIPTCRQLMEMETTANMPTSMDPAPVLKVADGYGDQNWINLIRQHLVAFGKQHNSIVPVDPETGELVPFPFLSRGE